MTKAEFKKLWLSDEDGGGLTFNDVADCAEEWKLYKTARTHDMNKVLNSVLNAAGISEEK